jgi:excisionase family DNA binding protein
MARTDGTYRPGVSIHEAAVMLGVSPTTVRRWVASGRLRSERYERPQGAVVRVFLGPEQATSDGVVRGQVPPVQVPPDAPPRAAEDVPPALTAWLSAVLAPVLAELSISRQQLVSQAETIGELRAQLAAGTQISPLEASGATVAPDPTWGLPWSRWPRGWIAGAATVLAIVAVVVVLGWR